IYNSAQSNVSNRFLPTGILPRAPGAGNLAGFNVYPNPYTGTTVITYTLNDETDPSWIKNRSNGVNVSLEVLNVLGKKVQVLVNEAQNSGKYNYSFSAKEQGYNSGIYILKLTVGERIYYKQLVEY
ncbi:MAG: T9SS type A sorting domain-containing protein, partial [Bacteroidetes bacterium]|nr:T9SS type A sorting domain-containing protein [Bacteroidota bacterium]